MNDFVLCPNLFHWKDWGPGLSRSNNGNKNKCPFSIYSNSPLHVLTESLQRDLRKNFPMGLFFNLLANECDPKNG